MGGNTYPFSGASYQTTDEGTFVLFDKSASVGASNPQKFCPSGFSSGAGVSFNVTVIIVADDVQFKVVSVT
ncbi:hypothetical protein D3C87_1612770 [compost metagenome]